jgi:hypothetical protein
MAARMVASKDSKKAAYSAASTGSLSAATKADCSAEYWDY